MAKTTKKTKKTAKNQEKVSVQFEDIWEGSVKWPRSPLETYLQEKHSNVLLGNLPLLDIDHQTGDTMMVIHKGFVIEFDRFHHRAHTQKAINKKVESYFSFPSAIVLPKLKRSAKAKAAKVNMILNGDEDEIVGLAGYGFTEPYMFPTISFNCLSRFYGRKLKGIHKPADLRKIGEWLRDGVLKVVDYTNDEFRPTSRSFKAKLKKAQDEHDYRKRQIAIRNTKETAMPPETGFTLIPTDTNKGYQWHRTGTVLIHDTRENGKTIILGRDEDTYFGCELPGHPKSIKAAFKMLVPKAAQDVAGVRRQGEWFAVPVDEKKVPSKTKAAYVLPGGWDCGISLPIEDDDSSLHIVYFNNDDAAGRMDKDGRLFAKNFTVNHSEEDHAELSGVQDQWYTFHCNTAVRSFSEDGVD